MKPCNAGPKPEVTPGGTAPQRITRDLKAWMAGVVEMRGKIRFVLAANHSQLVLQVQSQHIHLVEKLGELTGTKVGYQDEKTIKSARRLCTEHCEEAHVCIVATLKPMAIWHVSGAAAAIVLFNLTPFIVNDTGLMLIVDNVLDSLPKEGDLRGRSAVDQMIIRLKKLGWKIPNGAMEGFIGTPVKRGQGGKFVKPDSELVAV